jgi:hypothetical protein
VWRAGAAETFEVTVPMSSHDRFVYEIRYDVVEGRRDEYETWLAEATTQWIATAKFEGFRCEHRTTDRSPAVQLRLEFGARADWVAFVESAPYQQRFEELQTVTESLTTRRWEPRPISLDPTTDGGGPIAESDRREDDE